MKRIVTIFFSVFIVFMFISSSAEIVYAEEIEEGISQTDEITQQIDDMLADLSFYLEECAEDCIGENWDEVYDERFES